MDGRKKAPRADSQRYFFDVNLGIIATSFRNTFTAVC